jgi:starch phosphorylase
VYLNNLDPNAVRVEMYAEGINGGSPIRQEMTCVQPPAGETRRGIYRASVSATRPATDYTARIIPHCAGDAVPLEVDPILWQR